MNRAVPEVIIVQEASDQQEHPFTAFIPIQWEQERGEVKCAILYHRYACLKLRQLSRQQAAIDWSATTEKLTWEWSRRVGTFVFRIMFALGWR